MKREDLISKGYTEEQVTELLNLFHTESKGVNDNNSKLQKELEAANATITELNKVQKAYKDMQTSQMSEQEKLEATRKEIEEHLANAKLIESRANAKTIFAEIGGVSDDVLNSLVTSDISQTEANAKALVDLIKNRDEATVKKTKEEILNKKVLPSTVSNVTKGSEGSSNQMTKEEFNRLSTVEKTKIFREDKELWDKMTK